MARLTNEELQAENAALVEENKLLKMQLAAVKGGEAGSMPGWVIVTKNRGYNGSTAGVQFRHGQAFLPKQERYISVVETLKRDFGYEVTEIADITQLGENAHMTMADALI